MGAYILDRIALAFVTVPAEILRMSMMGTVDGKIDVFELSWLAIPILLAYFTIGEGVFGATPGKWLLGLRVSRLGQTTPPGWQRALLRTVVFHCVILAFAVSERLVEWFGSALGGVLGGMLFLCALAALLIQFRKKWGYRGVHDFASGCHVTQAPLPARRLRLSIRHGSPLQKLLPPTAEPLPENIGGFHIRGRIAVEASGEQVWVGEDRALARTVLLWLKPGISSSASKPEPFRPARLRGLGSGKLTFAGQSFEWTAFAAPLGGPLSYAIPPNRPLPWADARYLLDQLVEEFRAAEADGTTPARLTLDQVWVEPNGRVQLLDCPPSGAANSQPRSPFGLLREVTSLALEGHPRATAGPVRAPVPPHAMPILDKLFSEGGNPALADIQRELADTHAHRPEVTPAIRAAQLGIQAAALGPAVALLFLFVAGLGVILTHGAKVHAEYTEATLAALADPEERAKLAARPELTEPLKHPRLVTRLEELRDRKREEAEFRRSMLFAPQRFALDQAKTPGETYPVRPGWFPSQVRDAVQWAGAPENTPRGKSASPWRSDAWLVFVVLLAIPIALIVGSAILRGGISMMLAGIALVRADGRRATRRQCALRTAVVWFPIAALLFGAAILQAYAPERIYVAVSLWLVAVALLPVYAVIALRFPTQPPQDRITGTHLVPL